MQALRENHLLPSDMLAMARQNNPGLAITLGFPRREDAVTIGPIGSALVLRVVTSRGNLVYERGPRETWYDVFRRAGLLAR